MSETYFTFRKIFTYRRRIAHCTLGIICVLLIWCGPASAQFVCGGSATGSAPVTGSGSAAANQHDVVCGISAVSQGAATGISGGATSVGFGAFALGNNSTSIGSFSGASTPNAGVTSIGANANALGGAAGLYSTAIGAGADPNTGNQTQSVGNYSIAIGGGDGVGATAARALGDLSIAIGGSSLANSANATAVGSGSSANYSNSTALGNGATTTRANQQSFGTASNTYTMSGITSQVSKAVQSGSTQIVTADAGGNLATAAPSELGLASSTEFATISGRLSAIDGQINDLYDRTSRAYTGVAMAFAMAGVPTLLPEEKVAATVNYGTFSGANGVAVNAAVRLTKNAQFTGGVGYGDGGIVGGRVGLRIGF